MQSIEDVSQVKYVGATSSDVVLDSVEADLAEAYKYCDYRIMVLNTFDIGYRESNEQTKMRATKATVMTLQANVYAWRNKYDKAWEVFNRMATLADNNNVGHWNFPGNSYRDAGWFNFFRESELSFVEFLLDIAFTYQGRQPNPLMRITSNDPGSGGKHLVQPSLYAMRTYHPNYPAPGTVGKPADLGTQGAGSDIHRGFGRSFAGSAPFYNKVGSTPVIWKWIGTNTVEASTLDVPPNVRLPYESDAIFRIMRLTDTWLLRAEILNRLGRKSEAIECMNNIRNRTSVAASTVFTTGNVANLSIEQIEDEILRVRGIDLGFEGYRWYDLIRVANHRNSTQYLVDAVKRRAPVDQHAYLQARLSDKKYWYLPYNENELKLNPNLKQKDY
ncbi:MAG: RagB/SusD family nutrient uptake outer membrane protein [Pedobacter sp.]|nr:MAG: RagB/SusD family nutrient uptake outer membrane protein [Pedobacter sp.]